MSDIFTKVTVLGPIKDTKDLISTGSTTQISCHEVKQPCKKFHTFYHAEHTLLCILFYVVAFKYALWPCQADNFKMQY